MRVEEGVKELEAVRLAEPSLEEEGWDAAAAMEGVPDKEPVAELVGVGLPEGESVGDAVPVIEIPAAGGVAEGDKEMEADCEGEGMMGARTPMQGFSVVSVKPPALDSAK